MTMSRAYLAARYPDELRFRLAGGLCAWVIYYSPIMPTSFSYSFEFYAWLCMEFSPYGMVDMFAC